MARLEQIEVTIEKNGKVSLRTEGFTGSECLDATEGLEKLLGSSVVSREMTAEYYQKPPKQVLPEQVRLRK